MVLSVALIFLTFPLILYTAFDKYMRVETEGGASTLTIETLEVGQDAETRNPTVSLKNNLPTAIGGWIIWVIIAAMNNATLAFPGLGIRGD
jgi:metal iron transporter